jgi:hypothetical protein
MSWRSAGLSLAGARVPWRHAWRLIPGEAFNGPPAATCRSVSPTPRFVPLTDSAETLQSVTVHIVTHKGSPWRNERNPA